MTMLLPTQIVVVDRPRDNAGCPDCPDKRVNVGDDYKIALYQNKDGKTLWTQWLCGDCPHVKNESED